MKKTLKKIQKAILPSILMFFVSLSMGPTPVFATTVSDSFADTSKINTSSSSNIRISGGQLSMETNPDIGTGADGAVTISSVKNINTDTIADGRSYADGISYPVTALGTNTITTSSGGTGPVGWWKMDESANDTCSGGQDACDSSGNGLHGTATGASIISGYYGNARKFNGTSDFIEVLDNNALDVTTAFTIEAWTYRSTDSAGTERLISKSMSDSYDYWFQGQPERTLQCGLLKADGNGYYRTSIGTTPMGIWTHVACTFDTTNGFNIYINGELSNGGIGGTIGAARTSTRNLQIGRLGSGSVWYYSRNGLVDDARVYNYVRSATQVAEDMGNSSSTVPGIAANDTILLINQRGDATNNGNVGNFEFLTVQSVSNGVITTTSNLTKTYGVGGNSNLTGQRIMVQRVPNYTNVTVSNSAVFQDTFAGSTIDTLKWVEIDPNNSISQNNALILSSVTSVWNKALISQTTFNRTGQTLYAKFTSGASVATPNHHMIGWGANQTADPSYTQLVHGFYFNAGYLHTYQLGNSYSGYLGTYAANTTYEVKIPLLPNGAEYWIKGGVYTDWTLLWTDIALNTSPMRVLLSQYSTAGSYSEISVYQEGYLTTNNWNGVTGGILAFKANGTVTISGRVDATGKGYQGGAYSYGDSNGFGGDGGESYCGMGGLGNGTAGGGNGAAGGGSSNTGNGGAGSCGGGGGSYNATGGTGSASSGGSGGGGGGHGSGGGGGYGTFGYTGVNAGANGGTDTSGNGGTSAGSGGGGGTYGNADLTTRLMLGSGGGAGAAWYSGNTSGKGGGGGGAIMILANTLSLTGQINSHGQKGGWSYTCPASAYSGAGAGGAGGSILISGGGMTLGSNIIVASGGIGATGCANGAWGTYNSNAGGSGRVAVAGTSITGTTNPTYTDVNHLSGTGYKTSASAISTNLLSGVSSIDSIDEFIYNLSSKPVGTTATVQFSQNGSTWYNSSGVESGTDDLTTGSNNTIVVHNLGWSGGNFYYKVAFTGDGSSTPVLADISVTYTVTGYTDTSTNTTDTYSDNTKVNTSTSISYSITGGQLKMGIDPKGYWQMNEASGTTVSDSSGNSYTGTAGAQKPEVGFWMMNESANDSCAGGQDACDTSGNSYHGTATGTTIEAAKYGNGRRFNGTSDFIYLPVTTSPTAYTVEAWVKADTGSITTRNIFCRTTSSGCASAWSHQLRITSGGKFEHYTYDGGGKSVIGTTTVVADTWYHVAIVATNSSYIRLFVNGVEEGTAVTIGTLWTGGDRYNLGSNASGFSYFDGVIDDLRIYSSAQGATSIQYHSEDQYTGGPTVVAGKYSNGRNYITSDYVSVTDAAGLRLSASGMTWEAWINLADISKTRYLIYKNGNYMLTVNNPAAGNKISCYTYLDGAWKTPAVSTGVPATATWIHAACTWDGSNTRIYINGSLNGDPVVNTGTPNALTDTLYLGIWNRGIIDDVRIYSYARSAAQITEDMNNSLPSSSTIYSTNLLSNISNISSINSFVYNLSTLPANTTAAISFSNDGGVWYNSSGALNGTDSLSTGTNNTISLSTLGWTGANFYYKLVFTGDGTSTPTLDDITVNYTTTTSNVGTTWSACKPILGGNFVLTENCYFPHTLLVSPEANVDGADNGDVAINSYKTLTIKGDQRIARNNGKSLILNTGSSVAINDLTSGSGGNVRDYSGAGNEGFARGTIILAGKYGKARSFNGSTDWVDLDFGTVGSSLNGASAITFEGWINPSSLPDTGVRKRVISVNLAEAVGAGSGFVLGLYNDAGTVKVEAGGRSVNTDSYQTARETWSGGTGSWHHIAGVIDYPNDLITVYIDGVAGTPQSVTFGNTSYTQATPPEGYEDAIGAYRNNGTTADYWPGLLDDIRVYNYALSQAQIQDDMNYGSLNKNAPVAWYRFEDGGQIKETNLWVKDPDGDKWIFGPETRQKARANSPGTGWVRRNTVIGSITGDGRDGNLTFATNTNLNTYNHDGRTCNDGGDMVNYNVSSFSTTTNVHGHTVSTATLSSTPSTGCLLAGDLALLINLQGTSTASTNTGNYEFMKIFSVSNNVITFTTTKQKYYGDGASDDTNLGTATTNQRVMLQRIPQYGNVTVNTGVTVTPAAWNGQKGGVLMFSSNGTVTVTGSLSATALGYRGGTGQSGYGWNGESFDGFNGSGGSSSGAAGTNGGARSAGGTAVSPAGNRGGGGGTGSTTAGCCAEGATGGGAGGGYGGGGAGGGAGGGWDGFPGGWGGNGGATGARGGGGGGGGGQSVGGAGGNAGSNGVDGNYNGWCEYGRGGAVAAADESTGQGGGGGCAPNFGSGGGGGGGMYGIANLSDIFFGSGGGGASGRNGGAAGGIIIVHAPTITVTGSIASAGAAGIDATQAWGGSGDGSAGSILLRATTATLGTALTSAPKSNGNAPSFQGGGGGGAGEGRIAIGATTITGTTNPTHTSITAP